MWEMSRMSEGEAMSQENELPIDAPGDFYIIHNDCTGCEAPIPEAPGLLEMTSAGCAIRNQPGTEEETDQMIDAMWVNCMEALRYRGSCPKIQQKLITRNLGHLS